MRHEELTFTTDLLLSQKRQNRLIFLPSLADKVRVLLYIVMLRKLLHHSLAKNLLLPSCPFDENEATLQRKDWWTGRYF